MPSATKTKKSARSKLVLHFKDGRKPAKLGEIVVLKNGASAIVYEKSDSEGNKYASLKFVSVKKHSAHKKSAHKTSAHKSPMHHKKSAHKSPMHHKKSAHKSSTHKKSAHKSPMHEQHTKMNLPVLDLKPRSENNLTRNDFCF